MLIYHIVLPGVWADFRGRAEYRAESLDTEKFIHCSYAAQLDEVIDRYYRAEKQLIILEIDTEKLRARLVAEPSTNGEVFPHIYGSINLDAVLSIKQRSMLPAPEEKLAS